MTTQRDRRHLAARATAALALLLTAWAAVPPLTAARGNTQAAAASAGQRAKRDPLAKLAEPFPDAETLRRRRLAAENRPLFSSADPLTFTLSADFKAVNRDRNPESTTRHPATLTLATPGGPPRAIPVGLRTRGAVRLTPGLCSFVPLRLDFTGEAAKGTVFEGQNALKLVTHCQDDAEFDQYVVGEYLVYRLAAAFTARSFRARLARATYIDAATGKKVATRHAILIEHEDEVARRMEGRIAPLERQTFSQLDPDALTLMMLVQYMVGNTDFSIYYVHNTRLVQDRAGTLFPLAYDFDCTGVVNPRYAKPQPHFNIRTVRTRLYLGPCRTVEGLEPFLMIFRSKRSEVMALVDSVSDMDPQKRQEAKDYLGEFFATINNKAATRRAFVDGCASRHLM